MLACVCVGGITVPNILCVRGRPGVRFAIIYETTSRTAGWCGKLEHTRTHRVFALAMFFVIGRARAFFCVSSFFCEKVRLLRTNHSTLQRGMLHTAAEPEGGTATDFLRKWFIREYFSYA